MSLIAVVAVIVLLGPRPKVVLDWLADTGPPDGEDLRDWLRRREQASGPITEGAEKHIEYLDPARPGKTPYVVLYVHGFSATRQEISPIPERVAAALGANYYGARLTGHGMDGACLGDARAGDWLKDVAEAWQIACELGERVIVISCSTGGTLATWLAQQPSAQARLAALVLFSPNFELRRRSVRLFTWPWSRYWIRYLAGETYSWEPVGELSGKYWTHWYPTRVLHELQALVDAVRRSPVESIVTPTLFLYSPEDQVVNALQTDRIYRRWGASIKERVLVQGTEGESNHVFTGDIAAPHRTDTSVDQVLSFLRRLGIEMLTEARMPQHQLQQG